FAVITGKGLAACQLVAELCGVAGTPAPHSFTLYHFFIMAYSLSLLTNRTQCDAVLTYAQAKLSLLTYHTTQTNRRTENLSATASGMASELTGLNAYITAMTPVLTTLPAGRDRDRQANDLRIKTDRRDALMARQSQVGPEALIEAELDSALVDAQLPLVEELIALVTAHRATLPA
ncbi:MAG: hypothetical protein JWP58_1334, partial [Hymenobacter sp.]|nr:hypothetical protein [Hymenobacter sp.]